MFREHLVTRPLEIVHSRSTKNRSTKKEKKEKKKSFVFCVLWIADPCVVISLQPHQLTALLHPPHPNTLVTSRRAGGNHTAVGRHFAPIHLSTTTHQKHKNEQKKCKQKKVKSVVNVKKNNCFTTKKTHKTKRGQS